MLSRCSCPMLSKPASVSSMVVIQAAVLGGLLGLGGVNGTKVDYVMEYAPAGGILGAFVAGGNPVDLLKVKNALARLENLAEKPDLSGGIGKLSS